MNASSVVALDGVRLDVAEGEIHAVFGENKTLTDKEIDSIDWYVEGVEGKMPGK